MVGTKFGDRIAEYSEYVRINVGISTKGKTSYILQVGDQPLDQLRFAMESTGAVRQLMMMGLVFNTTIKFNSPAAEVQPMIDAMEDFMQEANAKLPDGCKGIQTAVRYRGVRTEQVRYRRHSAVSHRGLNHDIPRCDTAGLARVGHLWDFVVAVACVHHHFSGNYELDHDAIQLHFNFGGGFGGYRCDGLPGVDARRDSVDLHHHRCWSICRLYDSSRKALSF